MYVGQGPKLFAQRCLVFCLAPQCVKNGKALNTQHDVQMNVANYAYDS